MQLKEARDTQSRQIEKSRQENAALIERNKMLIRLSRQERKEKIMQEKVIESMRKELIDLRELLKASPELPNTISVTDHQPFKKRGASKVSGRSAELYTAVLTNKKLQRNGSRVASKSGGDVDEDSVMSTNSVVNLSLQTP